MQCARISEAYKPLEVADVPLPSLPDEGVLIKTLYSGVSRADLHVIDDETDLGQGNIFRHRDVLGERYVGLVPGQEICGKIMALGSKVPSRCSLSPGDTVIVYPWRGCGACEACSVGSSHLCDNNEWGTTDIGRGSNPGGFSTHVVLPEWTLAVKLPKNIPPYVGCMLPSSVLTSYSALTKARPFLEQAVRMRGVANLLVVGAGGLGFWSVVLVKSLFCDKNVKVIVADVNQDKLTEASNIGADDAVLWRDDKTALEELVSTTTVSGYNKIDAAIDYVGLPLTTDISLRCLQKGGGLVIPGLYGGNLELSIPTLVYNSVSIVGVRAGNKECLKDLVDLFAVQNIDTVPPLEYFQLSEINSALDKLRTDQIRGKALINFVD